MDGAAIPDFRGVEEFEKYNRLAELGWVENAWPKILVPLNQLRYSYWKGVLGDVRGQKVFDLGCGYGLLSESFAADGAKVVGMDPSKNLLKVARERAQERGLPISYQLGHAEQLQLEEKFDVVAAADVLEHVNDLDQVIKASCALLGKGGYYCFLTNNRTPEALQEIITLPEEVHQIVPRGYHEYDKFITPEELSAVLKKNGVTVKEVKGVSIDIETMTFTLIDDPNVMYIGYAIKE